MPKGKPQVSVGLPVYNGEEFLAAALESLLTQSFEDFEIIASDNASTDGTAAILDRFAARDPRVRVIRQPTNIGAAPNFNLVLEAAVGDYFRWAAHDDLCEPGYLERCVERLDEDPGLVVCHSAIAKVDENGAIVSHYPQIVQDGSHPSPARRFRAFASTRHPCLDVFGLIRSSALRQTRGIESFIGSDRALLAELALRGRFAWVDETLFLSRDHAGRSIRSMSLRERATWFDSSKRPRIVMPFWRLWKGLSQALSRVELPISERAKARLALGAWGFANARNLARDLKWAAQALTRRSPPPA